MVICQKVSSYQLPINYKDCCNEGIVIIFVK